MFKKLRKLFTRAHDEKGLYALATSRGLFDPSWYKQHYQVTLNDPFDLFLHFLRKSGIDGKSPSASFNAQAYLNTHHDVAAARMNPLEHYLRFGIREGRQYVAHEDNTGDRAPRSELKPQFDRPLGDPRCAIALHVFYEDFIPRFGSALHQFPISVDVLVTSPSAQILSRAEAEFSKINCVQKVVCRQTPNRGRNFGPLFVEFGDLLREYDLFCHLHSKKSLYTGREQTAWSDYLIEYLIQDKNVIRRMLQLFAEDARLGVYYPRTFRDIPYWAHHWLKNYHVGKSLLSSLDIKIKNGFIRYPVGGMFWARPSAISSLLEKRFSYDEFPEEIGQTDGTLQHAIERSIGVVAEHNGFCQFVYDPDVNSFSDRHEYIWYTYSTFDASLLNLAIDQRDLISFDVFDTVISRNCTNPDYAKFQVGEVLLQNGVISSAASYVDLRNQTEFEIRKERNFVGDVTLADISRKLADKLQLGAAGAEQLSSMEMSFDLNQIRGRELVVNAVHYALEKGKKVIFLSDTYYSSHFISKVLRKAGVRGDFDIYVSSELNRRKDRGDAWEYVLEKLSGGQRSSMLHIGDNLMSDIQMTADLGVMHFHLMNSLDKWRSYGLEAVYSFDPSDFSARALFWGHIIDRFGQNPFFTRGT